MHRFYAAYILSVFIVVACLLTTTSADTARQHHNHKMPHILKNPDGTVNFDAVKKETDFLKGKYAQTAENARKNAAAEEDKVKETSQGSSAAQGGQGDIVPPKAEGPQ